MMLSQLNKICIELGHPSEGTFHFQIFNCDIIWSTIVIRNNFIDRCHNLRRKFVSGHNVPRLYQSP